MELPHEVIVCRRPQVILPLGAPVAVVSQNPHELTGFQIDLDDRGQMARGSNGVTSGLIDDNSVGVGAITHGIIGLGPIEP